MGKVYNEFNRKHRGRLITQLMSRDGYNCQICDQPLDRHIRKPHSNEYITFDHKIPRSHGGNDKLENLRLAHQLCNMQRGNDPIPDDELFPEEEK